MIALALALGFVAGVIVTCGVVLVVLWHAGRDAGEGR